MSININVWCMLVHKRRNRKKQNPIISIEFCIP